MDDIDMTSFNTQSLVCPYCMCSISIKIYEPHLEKCNNMLLTVGCEVCGLTIKNDKNNEQYLEHILSKHTENEIKMHVKNQIILTFLGLNVNYNSNYNIGTDNNINYGFNNKLFSNNTKLFSSNLNNIYDSQINFLYTYKLVQCKLCQNVIGGDPINISNHLEGFHKCFFNKQPTLQCSTAISFKSNIKYYQCNLCYIYMEDNPKVRIFHNITFHNSVLPEEDEELNINFINNQNNSNLKLQLFCSLCTHVIQNYKTDFHEHHSFLDEFGKPNEMLTNLNNLTPKKNQTDFLPSFYPPNNIMYPNYNYYKNNNFLSHHPSSKLGLYKDFSKEFLNEKEISSNLDSYEEDWDDEPNKYNKKKVNLEVDKVLKEWTLYSSITRKIDDEFDVEFKNKFSPLMFDYVENLVSLGHYYSNEKKVSTAILLKRLKNEFNKFQEQLPCNFSSSFFIRADANYPQFIKVLIAGSRGTPYEHGLFEFDIYLPVSYPNEVPKCVLRTTGNGKIRFNPNLYSDGKVCLSLLGTWSGSSVEKWDPKVSSLVQLFLSLSSLVMNDRIIENEPSYGNSMNSITGLEENEGYSNIVRLGNISYAMIEMYKNPPTIFKDVVLEYFNFKGKELLEDIKIWKERYKNTKSKYTGLTNTHNYDWCGSMNYFEKNVNKYMDDLSKLIMK